MRLSASFWQTFKEAPKEAQIPSHQLMLRAGLIHKAGGGLYNYLPMGLKVIHKVEQIIREEHNKANCQEVNMTVVTPAELWQESGRWDVMGPEMLRFKDRGGRDFAISPTNEEAVVDIFRSGVKSYKQLPQTLYQINTKFRDEIRPRYGVMRSKEFVMKDAYSFSVDKECLDKTYETMYQVYTNILNRIGLQYIAVEADGGTMADGGAKTHEFQVLAESGEDHVIRCKSCVHADNSEKEEAIRNLSKNTSEKKKKKVATPNKATIDEVCSFLDMSQEYSLKSLVYFGVNDNDEFPVLLLLIGDDQLNEIKLAALLKTKHIRAASDGDIERLGLVKGFIGPAHLNKNVRIIVDEAVNENSPYITGANEKDYHYTGCVLKRDVASYETTDLRLAKAGDQCIKCKGQVEEIRGIEVGHIFQLGDKYTKSMNVTVLDKNGKSMHPIMGCYGIGVTRVVAAAIEQNCDEFGIVWPKSIAPFHVYFGVIGKSEAILNLATEIYNSLMDAGVETLFDDRGMGPGFMFKDADLLGLPLRIVLGERDYNQDGLFEIKTRKDGRTFKVSKDQLVSKVKELMSSL